MFPSEVLRFGCLHVDVLGPLEPSNGKRYVVTFIDRASRWFECCPTSDVTAATIVTALVETWLSRYGVPLQIVSDRGAQFTGSLFKSLCSILGTEHTPTCSYPPEANGLIERWHRRLKDALRAHAAPEWTEVLPWAVLGLRAAPRSDEDLSAFELLFGLPPRLPGSLLPSSGQRTALLADDV